MLNNNNADLAAALKIDDNNSEEMLYIKDTDDTKEAHQPKKARVSGNVRFAPTGKDSNQKLKTNQHNAGSS